MTVIIHGTLAKETQRECLTSFRSVLSASLIFNSGDNQSACATKHCVSGLKQLRQVSWNRLRDHRKLEGTRSPVPFPFPPSPLFPSTSPFLVPPASYPFLFYRIFHIGLFSSGLAVFWHVVDISDIAGPSVTTGRYRAVIGKTHSHPKSKRNIVGFHRKLLTLFRALHGRVYRIFGAWQNAGTWHAVLNRV